MNDRRDYAPNSTLKKSKVWNKDPKKKKQNGLRPIAKKKWDRYQRDRSWVRAVFADWLRLENWPTPETEVPCPKCGRSVLMSEIDLEHIRHREKFPELSKNPHNWQPMDGSCNEQKYYDDHGEDPDKRNVDYRSKSLVAYMEIRIAADWDQFGPNAFYPDDKSGAWNKTSKGLVARMGEG